MASIIDRNGTPILVGSRVNTSDTGEYSPGEVVAISDPDGDVDAEGHPYGINPKVDVQWEDADPGDLEIWPTSWTAKGPGDEGAPYQCDDLEVLG